MDTIREKHIKMPQNAIIAVTLNCNSRCVSCDIWKNENSKEEMPPSFYKNLPSSLVDINITGGDPFLRKDLPEIIDTVKQRCTNARVIISTNGLLTQRIKESAKRILEIDTQVAIRVSIDGLEETHEEIRGIPGGFKKALDSVKVLKEIGVKDLGIGFTISNKNVTMINNVHNLANQLGVEFSITSVTSSPIYFGDKEDLKPKDDDILKNQLDDLIRSELTCWNKKRWSRAYFDYTLFEYIRTKKRLFSCDAGESFFYLDPQGNVYPCDILNSKLGNLNDSSFNEIWASDKTNTVRNMAKNCNNCWMVCTAKTSLKENLGNISLWLIKNRLKVALGFRTL